MAKTRRAVVLFNLGGPDSLEAVRPFLQNLFSDPAIIGAPGLIRKALAWLIAKRRTPEAQEIYKQLGGRSPLLLETEAQEQALEAELGETTKVFIAMRYWHPFISETVAQVKDWTPDEVVLLPLYPQYSTTTTGSSVAAWQREAKKQGLVVPYRLMCCYPTLPGFIEAQANLLWRQLEGLPIKDTRVLFSAHGLPQSVVKGGDPYQWQIETTAAAIAQANDGVIPEWKVTYQSRVGPMKWLQPSTDDEIRRAGEEGRNIVLVPLSFVSEHSETLVELDIQYRDLANECGVPIYRRVATVRTEPVFISALANMIERAVGAIRSCEGGRMCPHSFNKCPQAGR